MTPPLRSPIEVARHLIIDWVIDEAEGGDTITDDLDDPGGVTRFGIASTYHPNVDVRNLTREGAEAIYTRDYWERCKCDDLPPVLAMALFDCAVNPGPTAAIRFLQQALRVRADGVIGPETLRAAAASSPEVVIPEMFGRRLVYWSTRGNAWKYMRGWANRVLRLEWLLVRHLLGATRP